MPASPAEVTIPPTDYLLWAASSDIIGPIGVGDVIVNDGSSDLTISDGIDLIKGIFPNPIGILGATDQTEIGNVGDKLKVEASIGAGGNQVTLEGGTDATIIGNVGDRLKVNLDEPIDTTETSPLTEIEIDGATDGTNIGNVGDRLKTETAIAPGEIVGIDPASKNVTVDNTSANPVPIIESDASILADTIANNRISRTLEEILRALKLQNFHLSQISDLGDVDGNGEVET